MKTERKVQDNISQVVKSEFGAETSVSIYVKGKIPKTPDFVMVYQEVGKRILEGEISLSTCKVFFYMVMNMSFENFIGIDLKTISEKIGMPLPTVKKAMGELKGFGMILSIKDNFDSRRNVYRLNPAIAWKGKVRNKIKAHKENPAQFKIFDDEAQHSLLPMSPKTLSVVSDSELK